MMRRAALTLLLGACLSLAAAYGAAVLSKRTPGEREVGS